MTETRIALIGCGAQAKYASEIFHLLPGMHVSYVLSPDNVIELPWLSNYTGAHIKGYDKMDELIVDERIDAAMVCIAKTSEKKQLFESFVNGKTEAVSAIHPSAQIASSATIGSGCIINSGAVIQPFAKIGTGVMIHANVVVEHDCIISNWANLAPGSQLAGWVQVEEGATIFTGASITPSQIIGKGATVGAGAVVVSDVAPGAKFVGVPAKQIRPNSSNL